MNTQQFYDKLNQLSTIYESNSSFPSWISHLQYNNLMNYALHTTVYYKSTDNISSNITNVQKLLREREPVNIAQRRHYDQQALMNLFGYDKSCYGEFNDSINISVFTVTPFRPSDTEQNMATIDNINTNININVLNVIAPAFDSYKQPDFKFFMSDEDKCKRFELIFDMIFTCAIEKGMDRIYITGFGLGVFRNDPNDYVIGFTKSYNKYVNHLNHTKLYYWSYSDDMTNKIKNSIPNINIEFSQVNYDMLWLYIVQIKEQYDITKVLFINAWDPYSVIGNGNNCDRSWDGHFGRRSAMSILALPQFNPHIKYIDLAI